MPNPLDLTDRLVLVTGASSGIGRETAVLLSQLNARLILAGRDQTRLEATREMLEGQRHRVESFDLNSLNQIDAWIQRLAREEGPLDGLVHGARLPFWATKKSNRFCARMSALRFCWPRHSARRAAIGRAPAWSTCPR